MMWRGSRTPVECLAECNPPVKGQGLPVHVRAIQGATGNAFVPNDLFSLTMPNKYIQLSKG